MPAPIAFFTIMMAFALGLVIGSGVESNTDFEYKATLVKLESYNSFCELNGFGELKSYDRHTFTCNSGKEIPINLLLGRD